MKTKGQGLSLQIIVVAVIALIILVVVVAIFNGKIKLFGKGASACNTKGGTCGGTTPDDANGGCGREKVYMPGTDCEIENRGVCCVSI